MLIGNYTICNSNSSKKSLALVRVKDSQGQILCEVRSVHSNPLSWIRKRPLSEERASFVQQLTICGVSAEDVAMLLQIPSKTK